MIASSLTWRTGTDTREAEHAATRSLAYEVAGDGPPLIFLHGLSGSGLWWSRNVPAFAHSFHTYTVDLPGFGESRRVRWSRLDDTADRIANWLADKELPPAHIAGHSLGGAVAARVATRHPDRIDRLVLVDAAIRHGEHAPPRVRCAARAPSDASRRGSRRSWCATCFAAIPGASSGRRSTRCKPTG